MSKEVLKFSLEWATSNDYSDRLTTAAFHVSAGGKAIWPVEGADHISLEIQADDLLSHLTEFWKPLILRQTYPISTQQPARPSLLRAEAEKRWGSTPTEVAEGEDAQVSAFEEAHDLSRSFAGQFDLPPLWLVREANRVLIETRSGLHMVPFETACEALTKTGDEIADRLEASHADRWSDLVRAWRARDLGEPAVLLAWAASLDQDVARTFAEEGILTAPHSVAEAANDNDELRVAARMASALPPQHIRQIIQLVNSFPKSPAPKLDDLTDRTVEYIDSNFSNHRPYEQGEAAANYVREQVNLASVQLIDIFSLVEDLSVSLNPKSVEPSTLFALAVWGSRHGPAILLNENTLTHQGDIRRSSVARVTLAHELCHLLLDRSHALSSVEVLNSRMPLDIESRAKAFAGELLLPGRVAADIWFRAKGPRSTDELDVFIRRTLCRNYGVTRSVAAWKLEHGLHSRGIDLRTLLDAVVPNR